MKIDIAKDELQVIRDVVDNSIYLREHVPFPGVYGNTAQILRKLNRKLNKALKQAYGHDCDGSHYRT